MTVSLLSTKLYIPHALANAVSRPQLVERLNEGLHRRLTLISAPAGFGKTTLVSEWLAMRERPVACLSLDEGDNDPIRFLAYLVAAVQTIAADIGESVLAALQSLQLPPIESLLTSLLNDIATLPGSFILVLDDYHVIDSQPVDEVLVFLVEHLPPQMHLVIATREDPHLPLARLRARGHLTELRAADLRFTPAEAADFLNRVMGLGLSGEDISALEARTEGWIAGLQMAAVSMQGHKDATGFIKSFTGSHRFVLDYLVEEVLGQQPPNIQAFLLRTSILDRMCGALCDAVLCDPSVPGQETLEYLERSNLFIVPLDNVRHWYRYHHLFSELLRQRLRQSLASSAGDEAISVAELHIRASQWFEDNGLEIEAFRHAAASNDVGRAERLIDGKGLHLHFRGVAAILDWLKSLPTTVLDARPSLWVRYASALLVGGQTTGVEDKLQAAEAALGAALQSAEPDNKTRDLIGQIAGTRATLAITQYQVEALLAESRRALEDLPPDTLLSLSRLRAESTMAMAHHFRGDRAVAGQGFTEALSIAEASGNTIYTSLALTGLGQIQESENQLHLAAETYKRVLQLMGDYSPPSAAEVHLGLARICYQWNDLEAAERHGQQSLQLARQYEQVIDRFIISEVFLARLKLAQGDVAGAAAILDHANQSALQNNFVHRMAEVATVKTLVLLRQGDLAAAAHLAQMYALPFCQARVFIAQGDPAAALAILEPLRPQVEAKNWQDELLRLMLLQGGALHAQGEREKATQVLGDALALAEPGGIIRLFVDEGEPMRLLLLDFKLWMEDQAREGHKPIQYVDKLLAAFAQAVPVPQPEVSNQKSTMVEPLSQRELDVLRLIAQGLSNHEISQRLFLALSTVKGHNRVIFSKLQVQNRTEAVARARELGLI